VVATGLSTALEAPFLLPAACCLLPSLPPAANPLVSKALYVAVTPESPHPGETTCN